MTLPAIPRTWTIDRLQSEARRAREYERRFNDHHEARSAEYYGDLARQLEAAIVERAKSGVKV